MRRVSGWLGAGMLALALAGCQAKNSDVHDVSTPGPPPPALTDAYLTDDRDNDVSKSTFPAQQEPIFFVFAAQNVQHVPIRAVWYADAPDGTTQSPLAEQELMSAGKDYNGTFSQRPPPQGWKAGTYRIDIYLGKALVHTEHFKIVANITQLDHNVDQEALGTPMPSSSPYGVLEPNVTPIPSGSHRIGRSGDGIARDAMGNPLISTADGFQLHTSARCRDVQFLLEIDDARQGFYENPDMTSDISLDFHPGLNNIRISWDAPSSKRDCQMAIAIKRNHRLRTLTQVHVFRNTPPQGSYVVKVRVQ